MRATRRGNIRIMSVRVQVPEILRGMPVFRGTRVAARALFDYLEAREPLDELLIDFPGVSRETALAALRSERLLFYPRLNADTLGPVCS